MKASYPWQLTKEGCTASYLWQLTNEGFIASYTRQLTNEGFKASHTRQLTKKGYTVSYIWQLMLVGKEAKIGLWLQVVASCCRLLRLFFNKISYHSHIYGICIHTQHMPKVNKEVKI